MKTHLFYISNVDEDICKISLISVYIRYTYDCNRIFQVIAVLWIQKANTLRADKTSKLTVMLNDLKIYYYYISLKMIVKF